MVVLGSAWDAASWTSRRTPEHAVRCSDPPVGVTLTVRGFPAGAGRTEHGIGPLKGPSRRHLGSDLPGSRAFALLAQRRLLGRKLRHPDPSRVAPDSTGCPRMVDRGGGNP